MIHRSSLLSFAISSLLLSSACQDKGSSDKPTQTPPEGGTALTPENGSAPPPGTTTPALDNPNGGTPINPGTVPPGEPLPTPGAGPVVPNPSPVPLPGPTPVPQPEPGPAPVPTPVPQPDPGPAPQPLPDPVPTAAGLQIKDRQFWVYTKVDRQLTFNTPWDETEGDAIVRDETQVPSYAEICLRRSQNAFEKIGESTAFKDKMESLLKEGATRDITFLVVTVDNNGERSNLRRLDRDAYFWHWNDPAKKPVLGMNLYSKGTWVWEVIASPNQCIQPDTKEMLRYLDYAAKRIAEKGAKL